MPRSPIRSGGKDIIVDDGAVLISLVQGEQVQIGFTLSWMSDLTGCTITAKVVEGENLPGDGREAPRQEAATTKAITSLTVLDPVPSDNKFIVIFPEDLIDTWEQPPTPDDPVYGFLAISIADTGIGDLQQIRVPVRGMVEMLYNPLESTA